MKRILIVDDDTSLYDPLKDMLEGEYELDFAASGNEAIERIAAQRPDAMLLDVRMGDMNGLELLDRHAETLRADPPIGVVVFTSLVRVPEQKDSIYELWQANDLVVDVLDKAQAVKPDFEEKLKGLLAKAVG